MLDKIIIIDYGMGNLRSVQKKISKIGLFAEISDNLKEIKSADKLILPGVGHFRMGVKNLKEKKIWDIMNEKVLNDGTPILGICLGMQLMAKYSFEGDIEGLGWIDADILKLKTKDELKYKVPHMGWNTLIFKKESPLIQHLSNDSMFYFTHSFYMKCNNLDDILSITDYDGEFVSAIHQNNIFGTQFHPEKSHDWGEILLENFLKTKIS